jgi:signal peptidase I
MQPFTIPTASLEKSLLIGDFLFVSKFHYGARTPLTAVSMPMVHDSIPFVHKKSYTNYPQLPYFRFPGLQQIERNDIVVFNWPVDTVYKFFDTSKRKALKPIDKEFRVIQWKSKTDKCTSIKNLWCCPNVHAFSFRIW